MNSQLKGGARARSSGPVARGAAPPPARNPLPGPRPPGQFIFAQILDEETGKPVSGASYEVVDERGKVVAAGKTDYTGHVRHEVERAGKYEVRLAEERKPPPPPPQEGESPAPHVIVARLVDEVTDEALAGASYEIIDGSGKVIARGKADDKGVVTREVPEVGSYEVRIVPEIANG